MDIVRFSNNELMSFLGGSLKRVKSFKYRYNKFVMKIKYKDDIELWYNALTGAIVALKGLEARNVLTSDDFCNYEDLLVQHYFIVPENFDEEAIMAEFRKRQERPILSTYLTKVTNYTILTTTQCNARCFYCYQHVTKHKSRMTKETAEKVARYIIDTSFEGDTIGIGWFGGEPLYNKEVIDIITTKVEGSGRNINAGIISNSYLFDEETCIKAVRDWHIGHVQVTLDGTEKVYNETKNYIYKNDPSPFKTIIKNIHTMLRYGLTVSVRINVGIHNVDDLRELVKFLGKEFKGVNNFSIYVHELFDENSKRLDSENKVIFENMYEIENLITSEGIRGRSLNVSDGVRTVHCMVDDTHSVVIMPNGDLGLCEHYDSQHLVSHIDNYTNMNMDEVKALSERVPYKEICEDCVFKPSCIKLKLCPDNPICNKYEKEYILKRTREDIIFLYEEWKASFNNQNNKCSCCNDPKK